jgi:sigma-E factor negative regulatory protein RseC
MEKQVEHEGTVTDILDHTMMVRIVTSSACSGCAAKSYCVPSENKDREIKVERFSGDFVLGERVRVIMLQSLGIKALCIAYIVPFILVMIALLISWVITGNELISGLSALFILLPYYLSIKIFNEKLEKTFRFQVRKIH